MAKAPKAIKADAAAVVVGKIIKENRDEKM
jgi:heptaprenylglyceryl phosphate synthase